MNKPKQLTFPWIKQNIASFDDFYFDPKNFGLKKNLLEEDDDLFLYGIKKSGKSFLLQSVCNFYASKNKSSLYIPIAEVMKYGISFMDSLDNLDVICIDDIDLINFDKEWEIAIFNLINDCLISKCRLIFSSAFNPSSIKFDLKDLISRIKKMDHIELFPVSEDKLNDALNFICNLRSINLGEKEINYLVTYSKRNISDLINIINKLDKTSMQLKRKITVPLIKEVI